MTQSTVTVQAIQFDKCQYHRQLKGSKCAKDFYCIRDYQKYQQQKKLKRVLSVRQSQGLKYEIEELCQFKNVYNSI